MQTLNFFGLSLALDGKEMMLPIFRMGSSSSVKYFSSVYSEDWLPQLGLITGYDEGQLLRRDTDSQLVCSLVRKSASYS